MFYKILEIFTCVRSWKYRDCIYRRALSEKRKGVVAAMKKRATESAYIADVEVIHRKEIFCKFPPELWHVHKMIKNGICYINVDYPPDERS